MNTNLWITVDYALLEFLIGIMKILNMGPIEYAKSILEEKPELPQNQKKYNPVWYWAVYPGIMYDYYQKFERLLNSYKERIIELKKKGVEISPEIEQKILECFGENILEKEK